MDPEDACSIFDNGDFMMGVVFAAEYFRDTEIELIAKQVYETLDWNKYGDYTNPTYSEEMIEIPVTTGVLSTDNGSGNYLILIGVVGGIIALLVVLIIGLLIFAKKAK